MNFIDRSKMNITRTFDLLDLFRDQYIKPDVFNIKQQGKWLAYSSQDYIDYSHDFSFGLLAMGFKPGDKMVTVTNNRPEWNFADMGMSMAGIIHVPVFTSLGTDELKFILIHSEARAVFVSDAKLHNLLDQAIRESGSTALLYSFDKLTHAANWMEIVELGRKHREQFRDEIESTKGKISPDDWATLIYTSGTTGMAKGVMLSHKNLVENFKAASAVFGLGPADRYLSILPLCHVGGRMGNYQTQFSGSSIYYAESMGTIANDMREIHADGFDTVPRILEKIFNSVIAKGNKLTGVKKKMFFWAVRLGLKYKLPEDSSWLYRKKHRIADKLIFSKWREALGGNIKLAGCGGASLQPRLERVFWSAGIKIINMYGLTETSPVITINRREKPFLKLGSVGRVIDGVEVKIADDGEILSRGHNIMIGYYKNSELTAEAIDPDGWFSTGDIGSLDEEGFLFITDRKKDVFKLSNGKFISPQMMEGRLKESMFIEHSIVVGEQEKFVSALIVPDFTFLRNWCLVNDVTFNSQEEIISLPQVKSVYAEEIKKLNQSVNPHEQISRFKLIPDEWSPESGELSPTLKLRRNFIMTKYQPVLEQIYPRTEI